MTAAEGGHPDVARMLRWYPEEWRRRYGAELAALVEDELEGREPSLRLWLSLARSGLGERAQAGGWTGGSRPPADRVRAGGLVVLLAWALTVVAAAAFVKTSEHAGGWGPSSWAAALRASHTVVLVGAAAGSAVVAVAVVLVLPGLPAFVRAGGWSTVRGPLVRAVVVTACAVLGLVGLATWAHHLTPVARNGGDAAYAAAFVAWAVAAASTVLLWAVAGVAVARRLAPGMRTLRVEAVLAGVLAAVGGVLAAAVVTWWVSAAVAFPAFLVGGPHGSHPVPVTAPLVLMAGLLLVAAVASAYGTVRIVRSWPFLPAA